MGAKVTGIGRREKIIKRKIYIHKLENLEELVKEHNFLIGLLPYDSKLKEIFNHKIFDKLPLNSYFLNNGRDSHVNENVLCIALEKNLSAAAIDVFEDLTKGHQRKLYECENLPVLHILELLTPHIGKNRVFCLNII